MHAVPFSILCCAMVTCTVRILTRTTPRYTSSSYVYVHGCMGMLHFRMLPWRWTPLVAACMIQSGCHRHAAAHMRVSWVSCRLEWPMPLQGTCAPSYLVTRGFDHCLHALSLGPHLIDPLLHLLFRGCRLLPCVHGLRGLRFVLDACVEQLVQRQQEGVRRLKAPKRRNFGLELGKGNAEEVEKNLAVFLALFQ